MSMKMYLPFPLLLLLLSFAHYGSSQNPVSPPPRGCGSDLAPAYRALCDLEAVWGVVLEGVVCGGILTSLVLSLVLLGRRRYVHDPGQLSGLGPLHLLLASLLGLFSLALAFLVGRSPALCLVRRALWGPLHALCFSSLVTQGVRLKKLVSGHRSPAGGTLVGAAVGLALVQGIVSGEWLLLTVAREGHAACDYPPLDFALVCSFALVLLLVAMTLALAVVLCGGGEGEGGEGDGGEARAGGGEGEKRRWRCNGVWLFLACLASALLWVGWLGFYLYGDPALKAGARARGRGRARALGAWRGGGGGAGGPEWDEPALAVALVSQGWVLLLFHAIPETHLCLRSPAQADDRGYHDGGQPTLTRRFPEDTPTSHPLRVYGAENQAFSIEEHSAALRGGAYHNSHGGIRPGIPFRGHVYQPTEMALVMNGGTMPTAPVNFTGRQLW